MESNPYETQTLLDEYLLFHYGKDEDLMPWPMGPKEGLHFPARTVQELIDPTRLPQTNSLRALDLGCAVGRSSYELSRHAQEVIGIDFSHRFIEAAQALQLQGQLSYCLKEEARKTRVAIAERPTGFDPARVHFQQGDAHQLPDSLGSFEVVHAANLLCRLSAPEKLLARFASLVRPGGQLLLTTPCTWLEEYTPKEAWPEDDTFTWLQRCLSAEFTLDAQVDLPFLIREHARKFQFSVALGTRWIRR